MTAPAAGLALVPIALGMGKPGSEIQPRVHKSWLLPAEAAETPRRGYSVLSIGPLWKHNGSYFCRLDRPGCGA
jgi:hypothetical protein